MGFLIVIIAIIAIIGSEVKQRLRLKELNSKTEEQRIIEQVLNEIYSYQDLFALRKEYNWKTYNDIFKLLVEQWCNEFEIKYVPYFIMYMGNNYHNSTISIDHSYEKIHKVIESRIEDSLVAKKLKKNP